MYNGFPSWRESQKPTQKLEESIAMLEEECKGDSEHRCYRSAHLLAFSIVLRMYAARFEVLGSRDR